MAGYYADKGSWPIVGMFGVLLILACAGIAVLIVGRPWPDGMTREILRTDVLAGRVTLAD